MLFLFSLICFYKMSFFLRLTNDFSTYFLKKMYFEFTSENDFLHKIFQLYRIYLSITIYKGMCPYFIMSILSFTI